MLVNAEAEVAEPPAESSALHPVVTFAATAASVALLQGAAAHNVLSMLSTGVIIDAFDWRATVRRDETLRQALASLLAATCVKAVSQALDIERAEALEAARRAAVRMRYMGRKAVGQKIMKRDPR